MTRTKTPCGHSSAARSTKDRGWEQVFGGVRSRSTTMRVPPPSAFLLAFAAIGVAPALAAGRTTFDILYASTEYDFRITMTHGCEPTLGASSACVGPGRLFIFRKGERAELQRLRFDALWVELGPNREPLVNAAHLYDAEGAINVGDYNFDGREDFAVQIDQTGPYGGPTFDVFLATAGGFVRSEALSRLTRETLGLFQVDAKRHRLVTFAKSGCCWHITEELEVVANEPVLVFRRTEDATGDEVIETEERRVNGRWLRTTRRTSKAP
jgi:hypothetical protein